MMLSLEETFVTINFPQIKNFKIFHSELEVFVENNYIRIKQGRSKLKRFGSMESCLTSGSNNLTGIPLPKREKKRKRNKTDPSINGLQAVELIFLPPNTTYKTKPMYGSRCD